ncbi:hypothetical protein CONCODRAFT_1836 [Conidiobolus coronatus NRRL 28638]|uniref:General stress protein FMN-binding split barrel domain-containing protein n=1 Tax=Conidiobolus coronatus (strain ATCC 28846 / CBS 209.66 / NRRL 28638) TaxID=796925 RepID=A0A137PJ91_CONC2|nr:hypothetical protein CONCODRAFT_1836 [Conidiobolus coronatus NRRL 28638]|eukprot:KXN75040.1 hypothetical protein CONCODRAFT_1836 [Conidiobolus coronatus NRRL 28638]
MSEKVMCKDRYNSTLLNGMSNAKFLKVEDSKDYNLEEVEMFTHELAQREDNELNPNALVYTDGSCSKMCDSKSSSKIQQNCDHRANNKSTKDVINYKRKDNRIMPSEIRDFDSAQIMHKVDRFINFIKDFDQLSLATVNSVTGLIKSRPMYTYDRIQDLHIYLLTHYDSDIISDIKKDSRVNLVIKGGEKKYTNWCSIGGNADIITDSKMVASLWSPTVKTWLNNLGDDLNNCSENDPRLTCIFIETNSIDYFICNNQ